MTLLVHRGPRLPPGLPQACSRRSPGVAAWERRSPYWFAVGLVVAGLVPRFWATSSGYDGDLIHSSLFVAWLFAGGWAAMRARHAGHRLLLSALLVAGLVGFCDDPAPRGDHRRSACWHWSGCRWCRWPRVIIGVVGQVAGASLLRLPDALAGLPLLRAPPAPGRSARLAPGRHRRVAAGRPRLGPRAVHLWRGLPSLSHPPQPSQQGNPMSLTRSAVGLAALAIGRLPLLAACSGTTSNEAGDLQRPARAAGRGDRGRRSRKMTGIKVEVRSGSDLELSKVLVQEGDAADADIFLPRTPPRCPRWRRAGLFQERRSTAAR